MSLGIWGYYWLKMMYEMVVFKIIKLIRYDFDLKCLWFVEKLVMIKYIKWNLCKNSSIFNELMNFFGIFCFV